jgi:hypothetical protein
MENLQSLVLRVLFAGAFALLALAVVERLANLLGYTLLREALLPSRLLEVSVVAMVFVIALVLRQIRDRLASGAR